MGGGGANKLIRRTSNTNRFWSADNAPAEMSALALEERDPSFCWQFYLQTTSAEVIKSANMTIDHIKSTNQ